MRSGASGAARFLPFAGRIAEGRALARVNAGLALFAVLYAVVGLLQPFYLEPPAFLNFLRRSAPLAVLATGQLFVIVTGGFDLSAGSTATLTVIGASMLTDGQPGRTGLAVAALYAIGLAVGLCNGLAVTVLRVPSIIATLGMLLSLNGLALWWCGGSPRGYLPDNFRMFGRLTLHGVPVLGIFPIAVGVLAAVAGGAWWLLHRTVFGRLVLAVGDNARAAELAGVPVRATRVAAFVLSSLSAVTAGIMLGGFGGVSVNVGAGLELQAIAACVIGGARLMGGRGTVVGAVSGALALFSLFTLLNLLGLPQALRDTAQGLVLIAAAASGARRTMRQT